MAWSAAVGSDWYASVLTSNRCTLFRRICGEVNEDTRAMLCTRMHVRLQLLPRGLELAQGHHHVW